MPSYMYRYIEKKTHIETINALCKYHKMNNKYKSI